MHFSAIAMSQRISKLQVKEQGTSKEKDLGAAHMPIKHI